jgi:ribosomal protein L20
MANPNPDTANLRRKDLTQEIRMKGAIASVKARRRKKEIREMIEMMLTMPIKNGAVKTPKSLANLKNANVEVFTAMLAVQCQKALKGDTKAFTAVVNVIKDNINININTAGSEIEDISNLAALLDLNDEENENEVIDSDIDVEEDNNEIVIDAETLKGDE